MNISAANRCRPYWIILIVVNDSDTEFVTDEETMPVNNTLDIIYSLLPKQTFTW